MAERATTMHRLDRRDWVNAGIEMLCVAGVELVRVEALAKKLGISKGSFYWHFRDRDDLLAAILDEWQEQQSDWNRGNGAAQSPVERWTSLFEIFDRRDYASFELAMSAWARQDASVARRLAEAERKRIAYISSIFREIGFSQVQSAEWANAAFLLYLGWMDRAARASEAHGAVPPIAEVLSRFVLAASALASQEALQQSKR